MIAFFKNKEKSKKNFKKTNLSDSPFKVLKNINFS